MSLHAIIFDFDGVLADTEKLHLLAFQEVLGEQGVQLSEENYYTRYLGLDDYHVLLAIASDCALPAGDARVRSLLERKARRYAQLIATSPLLFDGVEPLVRDWSRHVPLAIASGALRREIDYALGRRNLLECFRAIVAAGDVARGKPAPDPYLAALEALRAAAAADKGQRSPYGPTFGRSDVRTFGRSDARTPGAESDILPAGCVVIEDSLPGIAAARAAGMRTVAVTTNHPPERLAHADLVVPSVVSLDLVKLDALVTSG